MQLLDALFARKDELEPKHRRIVEVMHKEIENMRKIPMDEYIAYQELMVKADDVWHTAKENSDFASFCPILEEIFATTVRFAGYCAPEMKPYDYCLNKYEEGLTMEKCDAFFSALKAKIVPLIAKIGQAKQVDDTCLHGVFDTASQEKFFSCANGDDGH